MSEPKRVTFETIPSGSSKNLAADASQKNEKTVRFELKLFEPNADNYPLFNFKTLCQAEKLKEKQKIPLPNGFADPLEEVDHDAEKLAQEFERKYGNGYDENNGFIDDSEAFDEVIPDEMDTDRGGFYINSGPLQFKKLSNKAPKRALPLTSDDESDSMSENSVTIENGNATKKPKMSETEKIIPTNKEKSIDLVKKDKLPINVNVSETIKDGNKEVKTTTVMSMLRAQRDANILKTTSHINKGSKSTSSATSDDSSSSDSSSSDSSSDADPSRHSDEDDFESIKNTGTEIRAIDSVPASSVPNKIQINGTSSLTSSSSSQINNIPQEPDITFFEQLTQNQRDSINRLIDYSKNPKENFFQTEMLDLLYEVVKAHSSDSKLQNQIYTYLEQLTPYTKQQLTSEVNEHAIKKSENDVRTHERILQKEINQIMPGVEERYLHEVKKAEELKAAAKGTDKSEQIIRNPRKKFPWNDNLRSSVNKLILKWQSLYEQKQIRDQTLEQYTTAYITDKLVPMWPNGWMKFNDIQSHFMPKPKVKDPKKPANDVKISKPLQSTAPIVQASIPIVDNVVMVHNTEKKKSHSHKDPSKSIKNANDKPTLTKTDKKHPQYQISALDRPSMVTSLPSMPINDSFNSKTGTAKPLLDALNAIPSASINIKSKSITSSNGNAANYVRPTDNSLSIEYVSPTKKASDHSISQLISSSTSNHSAYAPTMKHQSQLLGHSSYADNPTTSAHSVSSKSTQGSSSKKYETLPFKIDIRPPSSNGSNNNSFQHNNNNSKPTVPFIDLCDTDDGESAAKKSKPNKHKHNKKSKESEQRNSLPMPNNVHMLNQLHQPTALGANATTSDEVDHNQIIHDLKK